MTSPRPATGGPPEATDRSEPTTVDHRPPSQPLGTVDGVSDVAEPLTPLQRRTLDALRRAGDPLVFDAELIADIRTEMRIALDEFAERLEPGQDIFVTKHRIGSACSAARSSTSLPTTFAWTPATAKRAGRPPGDPADAVNWRGEPVPTDVVDEAMARLADDDRGSATGSPGSPPPTRPTCAGMSVERVTKFIECFPPLDKRATPDDRGAPRNGRSTGRSCCRARSTS